MKAAQANREGPETLQSIQEGFTAECARRWGHVERCVWREVKRPRAPELLPSDISRGDFQKILRATPDLDFRELVFTATTTGVRRGELLAMRWGAVDFVRGTVTIGGTGDFTTKTKKARGVPIPG